MLVEWMDRERVLMLAQLWDISLVPQMVDW